VPLLSVSPQAASLDLGSLRKKLSWEEEDILDRVVEEEGVEYGGQGLCCIEEEESVSMVAQGHNSRGIGCPKSII
jgi:hypothetical protein